MPSSAAGGAGRTARGRGGDSAYKNKKGPVKTAGRARDKTRKSAPRVSCILRRSCSAACVPPLFEVSVADPCCDACLPQPRLLYQLIDSTENDERALSARLKHLGLYAANTYAATCSCSPLTPMMTRFPFLLPYLLINLSTSVAQSLSTTPNHTVKYTANYPIPASEMVHASSAHCRISSMARQTTTSPSGPKSATSSYTTRTNL